MQLHRYLKFSLYVLSFIIVAFGQPAWSWSLGLLAAVCGYAIFWLALLNESFYKRRFWIATLWFMGVQLVQLSWLNTHPYSYIYAVYFLFSFLMGVQFGVLGLFITRQKCQYISNLLGIAALWTLMEWSRLFVFSGFSWNPVGLSLTSGVYPMQMASLWGMYGMSFWVIFVNLLGLRGWLKEKLSSFLLFGLASLTPYLYGMYQFSEHEHSINTRETINIVLVQTSFPIEEIMDFSSRKEMISYVMTEWQQILSLLQKQKNHAIDLIVLPEYVVPFGTYSPIFPYDFVKKTFREILGEDSLPHLASLEAPYAQEYATPSGNVWFVNNAFWLQSLANIYHSAVVAGLEDVEELSPGQFAYYSAAIHFNPFTLPSERYAKRVLLPFAEYIPFEFCKKIAAEYGIGGSFCPGKEAVIFHHDKASFGVSICYEETFGHLMRETRRNGAELLVNLTNDSWYPNSRLTHQHFDHARLRSIENGIPHVRACNTGLTCGIDSLGRVIAKIEGDDSVADSIYIKVSTYHYPTLYSQCGDYLIIGMSFFLSLWFFWKHKRSHL